MRDELWFRSFELHVFGLVHLGTVHATSCCEQKPSRKQLRRKAGSGDSRVAGMSSGNSSPSSISVEWRQGLEAELGHDPQDPSPGSTTSQNSIVAWRPNIQTHAPWEILSIQTINRDMLH